MWLILFVVLEKLDFKRILKFHSVDVVVVYAAVVVEKSGFKLTLKLHFDVVLLIIAVAVVVVVVRMAFGQRDFVDQVKKELL